MKLQTLQIFHQDMSFFFHSSINYFMLIVNNMTLTFTISDIQCFTVQPVLEEQPRFKNKAVPDQIIK